MSHASVRIVRLGRTTRSSSGRHHGDRARDAGSAAQRRDAPAGLHGVAHGPEPRAQPARSASRSSATSVTPHSAAPPPRRRRARAARRPRRRTPRRAGRPAAAVPPPPARRGHVADARAGRTRRVGARRPCAATDVVRTTTWSTAHTPLGCARGGRRRARVERATPSSAASAGAPSSTSPSRPSPAARAGEPQRHAVAARSPRRRRPRTRAPPTRRVVGQDDLGDAGAAHARRRGRRGRAAVGDHVEQRPPAARQRRPGEAGQRVGAAAAARRARSAGSASTSVSAPARPASSSGSTSQPVRPASTMSAGPMRSTATGGRPQAIPSTSTEPNCSRDRRERERVGAAQQLGQLVVVVPAGQEHVARPSRARRPSGCSPSHSPG